MKTSVCVFVCEVRICRYKHEYVCTKCFWSCTILVWNCFVRLHEYVCVYESERERRRERVRGPACLRGAEWYGVMLQRPTDKLIHLLTLLTRLSDFVKWTIDQASSLSPCSVFVSLSCSLTLLSPDLSLSFSFPPSFFLLFHSDFLCRFLPFPSFYFFLPLYPALPFLWLASWQAWHVQ